MSRLHGHGDVIALVLLAAALMLACVIGLSR
jgi:hypothetical protein